MSRTTRSDSSAESATIAVPGDASPISRVARNPPPPGIWTSTIATSGPALGGARDRLVSVAGGADDLEAVAELRDEDGADVGVVVGDEYAGDLLRHGREPYGGAPRRGRCGYGSSASMRSTTNVGASSAASP